MSNRPDKNSIERKEKQHDRQDGNAPVSEGGNPSPSGQDEPRNEDIAKRTV